MSNFEQKISTQELVFENKSSQLQAKTNSMLEKIALHIENDLVLTKKSREVRKEEMPEK